MPVPRLPAWATPVVAALAVVTVAVVTLAGTGCTVLTGARAPSGPSVLSVGITEPQRLLPADVREPDGAQVIGALFSPLVEIGADARPAFVAAESVTSRDNRVWTIKLRAGFTFHNGEAVTAEHYLAAWNYAAYAPNRQTRSYLFSLVAGYAALQSVDPDGAGPRSAPRPAASALAGLRRMDQLTFTVTLLQPFNDFVAMLANPAFAPLPSAAWRSAGVLRPGYADAPIGNGPFRMRGARQPGTDITVDRYDAFPGTKPQLAGIEFRVYPQQGAAYADVVAGRLDVVTAIAPPRLAAAATELAGRVHAGPGPVVQFLSFPATHRAFSDTRVRRAISMAIDRDQAVRSGLGTGQDPARSFVAPVVPGYRPGACGESCRFDPVAARQLYRAAGGPAQVQIAYPADGAPADWVDPICRQLTANLGVGCAGVAQPTFGHLLAAVRGGTLTALYRMSWDLDYASMENYLGPLYTSVGAANYAGYRNPQFDESVRRGAAARTPKEAVLQYQRAEDLLAADMPAIPLRSSRTAVGYAAAVGNVQTDRTGRLNLAGITKR